MAFLDETGLAELWSLVKAGDTTVTNLANTKCKVAFGNYTGTAKYGSSNPNSLTFDFAPRIVWIYAMLNGSSISDENTVFVCDNMTTSYALRGGTSATLYSKKSSNGKTIYWYHTSSHDSQLNGAFKFYYYAIG